MELTLSGPGGDRSRRYVLANGETIIGRRPDCRIVLDAPSISARHARLFTVDGHAVIHGIDEARPVYVNGEPVKRRVLAAGDEIELGPYRLRYTDGDDAATVQPEPGANSEAAHETDPGPLETGPAAPPERPYPVTGDRGAPPAHFSLSRGTPMDADAAADVPAEPEPVTAAPLESEPAAPSFPGPVPETIVTVDREHTDAAWEIADPDDKDAAPPDSVEPGFEDTVFPDPEPVEPDRAPPVETRPTDTEEAPPVADDAAFASDDDEPQAAPVEGEPERAGEFHLDILTGINRGRRVTLTNDLVVLGFNQQRLVEIRNDDGALSLRRLDDDAAAELNGSSITEEPAEAKPDDVISLQRIEMRIHQDRP